MTILVVGNNEVLLERLGDNLPSIYPDANVIIQRDPLMAGKYSFAYEVDILITEINMKRMNGPQLIDFVRLEKPDVLAFLVGTRAELDDSPAVVPEDATGVILCPFTQESLKKAFAKYMESKDKT